MALAIAFGLLISKAASANSLPDVGTPDASEEPRASEVPGPISSRPSAAPVEVEVRSVAEMRANWSELESSVVDEVLQEGGYELEPNPEGKWIEDIEVHTLEVFDDRDPVPNWVNFFHVRSRDAVIRSELLVRKGQRYDPVLVGESARNLRTVRQVSLVLLVPVRGSHPDRVRLLAIVKDVWSLRLNSNFGFGGGGGLDFLLLNPSEENLFGTHTTVGLLYLLERSRQSFGMRFVDRRLGDTQLRLAAQASISFERETGDVEGSNGWFVFEQPLYSRYDAWGFSSRVAWRRELTRRFDGSQVKLFPVETSSGVIFLEEQYDTDLLAAEYFGVRSFGTTYKTDLTFGLESDRRSFRMIDPELFPPEAVEVFEEDVLPTSDTRISPFVQIHSYTSNFLRTLNLDALGLQEDFRLGHDVLLRMYPSSREIGSSRTSLGALATVGYTVPWGNGLVRALASSEITVANDAKNDALLWLQGRVATPMLGIARLHLDGIFGLRYENYLNAPPFVLGGNNRLRGYRFDQLQGENVVVGNAELRTEPVTILSALVGLAAFYDVGDAPDDLDQFDPRHGMGLGLRLLIPQAERIVLRLDYGYPISERDSSGTFFVAFDQAFGMPIVWEPSVTTRVAER